MVLKYIVNRVSIMALAMILCAVGSSAAGRSDKPRPVVVSTNPSDGAVDVAVQTSITVNFSVPMDCRSINKSTFRLKRVGFWDVLPRTVTCSGSIASLIPAQDLLVSTRYKLRIIGTVKAANGTKLKDGFISGFTTGPNSRPPATATPTATATSTPESTATATGTATATATDTATATATPTDTATATATSSTTATATDTATATPTATATDTQTATASATPTDTATPTATATDTATSTATATDTQTATATATETATATPTTTATDTQTATPTATDRYSDFNSDCYDERPQLLPRRRPSHSYRNADRYGDGDRN